MTCPYHHIIDIDDGDDAAPQRRTGDSAVQLQLITKMEITILK